MRFPKLASRFPCEPSFHPGLDEVDYDYDFDSHTNHQRWDLANVKSGDEGADERPDYGDDSHRYSQSPCPPSSLKEAVSENESEDGDSQACHPHYGEEESRIVRYPLRQGGVLERFVDQGIVPESSNDK